jgi:hypothetical protein
MSLTLSACRPVALRASLAPLRSGSRRQRLVNPHTRALRIKAEGTQDPAAADPQQINPDSQDKPDKKAPSDPNDAGGAPAQFDNPVDGGDDLAPGKDGPGGKWPP